MAGAVLALSLIMIASNAYAAVDYHRVDPGTEITSPVTIHWSGTLSELNDAASVNCGEPDFWTMGVSDDFGTTFKVAGGGEIDSSGNSGVTPVYDVGDAQEPGISTNHDFVIELPVGFEADAVVLLCYTHSQGYWTPTTYYESIDPGVPVFTIIEGEEETEEPTYGSSTEVQAVATAITFGFGSMIFVMTAAASFAYTLKR